eukprot:CAMPEP_0194503438 /NCGR_PEP_ID=MMETSP0253-20130528/28380_1 /TAXON_ID=2966 /ORGANISM="Noctiluca scintillans" /LENGTH=562 /DNA_ID=CAMNT_0039345721 /DNA_START=70 /DNA_END=1758 /DNA_ORIENTATION=-
MAFSSAGFMSATLIVSCFPTVWASGFLVNRELSAGANSSVFEFEIQEAMSEVLGCGGQLSSSKFDEIRQALSSTWRTLPKNRYDQIDRSSFRYLARRYFMRSGIVVRGFESTRLVNSSHWGAADILSQRVPGYVESVLASRHIEERGFSLEDGIVLIGTLLQLIFDSESTNLEAAYRSQRLRVQSNVNIGTLIRVLDDYMVRWMIGEDAESLKILLNNQSLVEQAVPRWKDIQNFVAGEVTRLHHKRGDTILRSAEYSFQDAHDVVGSITRNFATFWESECDNMKAQLITMDKRGTGRVPLSRFYASALETEWRFGESEAYLQELGALDDTSAWYGKEVIIPNYIQGTSNCIVATSHYHVCCLNICEEILGEIEETLQSWNAEPADILRVVSGMSAPSSILDDGLPNLPKSMVLQLSQVAEASGGKVALHGRLFQQWLHYVFPRECAFPHKAGMTSSIRPNEFGEDFYASAQEMAKHAQGATLVPQRLPGLNESSDWMSQWSSDEELFATVGDELRSTSLNWWFLVGGVLLLFIVGISAGCLGLSQGGKLSNPLGRTHAHYV